MSHGLQWTIGRFHAAVNCVADATGQPVHVVCQQLREASALTGRPTGELLQEAVVRVLGGEAPWPQVGSAPWMVRADMEHWGE